MTQIIATNEGHTDFEITPSGTFVGRCYSMVYLGTVTEDYMGEEKHLKRVRLTFELPTKLKVFKQERGEEPLVISKEFTLSMHEKATLRKFLEGWRGKAFTEDQAKNFDVVKLLGKACTLNIIHRTSKKGKQYAEISSASPVMEGMTAPDQINPDFVFSVLEWNQEKFDQMGEWLQNRIKESAEYRHIQAGEPLHNDVAQPEVDDDLPF